MSTKNKNRYINLKENGKLFPSWIIDKFKGYSMPKIDINDETDACKDKQTSHELRKYQLFLSAYLDISSPFNSILIYHGLGSGKTVSAINIYNTLYNSSPNWNVYILLKATLKDDPWLKDLKHWLQKDSYDDRMANIHFISYDSPIADKNFMETVKKTNINNKSIYIIEEAHNFIRNVYSNVSTQQGRRAQNIYDYILNEKNTDSSTRVILLSGTPAINNPFELSLMFNLLRPGVFPRSEAAFNQYFVSTGLYKILNTATKNTFQRRILGLVSYYNSETPDVFASKKVFIENIKMDRYQEEVYNYFDEIEVKMAIKNKKTGSYNILTRQSSNFVFPDINQQLNGINRPRPSKFKLSSREAEHLLEIGATDKDMLDKTKKENYDKYIAALENYVSSFKKYLQKESKLDLFKDFELYKKNYSNIENGWNKFNEDKKIVKSSLYTILYRSSAKFLKVIFNMLLSPGPVIVYSNFVGIEGLEVFKIYLDQFNFGSYDIESSTKYKYIEYHGGIKKEQRYTNIKTFNQEKNIDGSIIKAILISSAGAEGLNLMSVRQVHIIDPYWNETRIIQVIGRAIRLCSHRYLPIKDRHVDIYRYNTVLTSSDKDSIEQKIHISSTSKQNLIDSFLDAMKEAAVDCVLNKNVNSITKEYKCFGFNQEDLISKNIGPAYLEDLIDDIKYSTGSNAETTITETVKVKKIKAVMVVSPNKYTEPLDYLLDTNTNILYDTEFNYPVGKIQTDIDGTVIKLDKNTYVIEDVVPMIH